MFAATGSFGSTMTGKTDEIVTYVQQQTDRLSQMIDSKRGTLVDALGAKANQLTVDIDRVTADALKAIESRGQTFSQTMLTNGTDVARTITTAGELATGAVNKSLKDLEQTSQHRHRAVAPGLDRRRHRNAGDQQDPAHRHGRSVRAAA